MTKLIRFWTRSLAKIGIFAAAATLAITAAVVAPASPAMADTCSNWNRTYYWGDSQTQIDNCPGTGDSWAWVWGPSYPGRWTQVWVQFYSGSQAWCTASCSWPSGDVWRFQIQAADYNGYYYSPVQYM